MYKEFNKQLIKVLLLTILLIIDSCATHKPQGNTSKPPQHFDHQNYFRGCATITSQCSL